MSLMGMRRAVKQYGTPIWIFLALVLVAGAGFTGLGSYLTGPDPQTRGGENEPAVATVGDVKVTRTALDRQLDQMLQQQRAFMPNPSPLDAARMRVMLLDQYKQQQALVQAAKQAGVTIGDADVARMRDETWAQQRSSVLQALQLNDKATDREIDQALARQQPGLSVSVLKEQYPEEQLRLQLYQQGLQNQLKKQVQAKATEDAVRKSYNEIQVRHVLIKSGEGGLPEEQAKAKAQKILDTALKDPAQLAKLARENSDDPGSKDKGGFYDWAPAGRYVPAFGEAALSVKPGQVVPELVKTPFGFHVIQLVQSRPGKDLPKDFDKNKQKYIDQYVDTQAAQKVQEVVAAATPGIKVAVQDPALRAAQLQLETASLPDKKAREPKLREALAELQKVKPADDPGGVIPFQKATLYEALDQPKEAIEAYKESLKFRNSLETHLALGQLYLKQKDNANAVASLQTAEKLIRGEIQSQFQLATLYKQAGRADLAGAAEKKAQEMLQRQAAMSKASAPPPAAAPVPADPKAATGGANGANGSAAPETAR